MFIKLRKCLQLILISSIVACGSLIPSATRTLYAEGGPLKVVTTQAMYADLVKQIGGDKVDVKFVALPKFNVHFIQPRPSDVRNVARADLVVYTGLDLEAWWEPLLEAGGKPDLFPGRQRSVDMSRGIRLLDVPDHPLSRAEGDIHLFGNPHFAMNPENVKIMVGTALEKLSNVDPTQASFYEENYKAFISKLDGKIAEWRSLCAACRGQEIISYHKDIVYFADFLGIKAEQYLEPKPGIPPTPKHLEFLEGYVKAHKIKAIAMPTYFPRDAAEDLNKRIGGKVVTICQNLGELPGTEDVFSFFDYNFKQISDALK